MKDLHILITNDDGIHAPGIKYLSQKIFEAGCYRISIFAPDRERSAIGHAITMHRPLRVDKVDFLHNPELTGWAVNGTPSDCVKLAVEAILEEKPDLVISGINQGSNLGTDVLYSGTVSAAVEGLIMGIPSIAVSLTDRGDSSCYNFAAAFICNLIQGLIKSSILPATLINVNVPAAVDRIRGAKVTSLGSRRYRNIFEKRVDPRGKFYYWLAGELVDDDPEDEDSDTKAIRDGFISVTPIHFPLTNRAVMADLAKVVASVRLSG